MHRQARIVGTTLVLATLLAVLPALGAEGRIPVWQPIQILPGGEGSYIVTRDVSANPGAPIIDVQPGTVAVDIDLNGFTLYGLDQDVIRALGVDSLTVRNGTIMFGTGGILAQDCRKVVIENVKIQFQEGIGIQLLEVANFAIRRNIMVNAGGDGILIDSFLDPSTVTQGTIEDNILRECGGGVSVFNGSSVAIENNRIEGTVASNAIFVELCGACLISENTIQEAFLNGMELNRFFSGKVYNNMVTFCQAEGIWVSQASDDNLVLNNISGQNGFNGMLVDGNQNHVERNVLNRNGTSGVAPFWGLTINGFTNTYRGNTAQGNPGAPPICAVVGTTDFCDNGAANVSPFNQPPTLAGDNLMPGLL